jgi:hypothetical protein
VAAIPFAAMLVPKNPLLLPWPQVPTGRGRNFPSII